MDMKIVTKNAKRVNPEIVVKIATPNSGMEIMQAEKTISGWEKLVLYGNGKDIKGVLSVMNSNIDPTYISAWMLRSVIAQVCTGKPLKKYGKLQMFTEAEKETIDKGTEFFANKYLQVAGRDGNGNPKGYRAVLYKFDCIAFIATAETLLRCGLDCNLKTVIYRAVTGNRGEISQECLGKLNGFINNKCMYVLATMFDMCLKKQPKVNMKDKTIKLTTVLSHEGCIAFINRCVAEING